MSRSYIVEHINFLKELTTHDSILYAFIAYLREDECIEANLKQEGVESRTAYMFIGFFLRKPVIRL